VWLCMSVSRIRADFALLLCGVWVGGLWAVVVACRLLFFGSTAHWTSERLASWLELACYS
jgi:hypothetical protein